MNTENQNEITLDDVFNQNEDVIETPEEKTQITLNDVLGESTKEIVVEESFKEEDKVIEAPKAEERKKTSVWAELIKEHLDDEEWQDSILDIDGKQVKLSELEDVDKNTYKRIKKSFEDREKEVNKGKFISTEGLSEEDKKLFELKRKGEDITPFLQYEKDFLHPLRNIDLEDPRVQEDLVRRELAHKGDDPEEIDVKIDLYKRKFILDQKASDAVKTVDDLYKKTINERIAERDREYAEFEAEQKESKKATIAQYKSFGFDDKTIKPLIDAAFKIENDLTEADRLYFNSKKSDPELFAKVVHLLKDKKQFEEFFGTKIKNKNALEQIIHISTIDKKVSSAQQEQTKKDAWDDVPVIIR